MSSFHFTGIATDEISRAILTHCVDSADALMIAVLKGADNATQVLEVLAESMDDSSHAQQQLDRLFVEGSARWGCSIRAHGVHVFHEHCARWRSQLQELPTTSYEGLGAWFTRDGLYWLVTPHSSYWPRGLNDLSIRSDWAPPLCLWGLGDQNALISCEQPIGIVGSRGCAPYGRQVASQLACVSALAGHTVVSGGAMGTDAAAHWGALRAYEQKGNEHAGRTLAVFAGGLNHIGPSSNIQLFEHIQSAHGALLSECTPHTVPVARRFLLRNRIIAALSSTIIVAQARLRSGALNTAHWANELNRPVFAVPGMVTTPHHAGCHELIRNQEAVLLSDPESIEECTHEAHQPRHMVALRDDSEPHEQEPDNESSSYACIREALQYLQKQGINATANTLLHGIRHLHPDTATSIIDVQTQLGAMEQAQILHVDTTGRIIMH